MTTQTLEQLEERYNNSVKLLAYSARTGLLPTLQRVVERNHRNSSNAYFHEKHKKWYGRVNQN